MKWYLGCWKKYATFAGRARRREYWLFALFNVIAGIVATIIDGILGTAPTLYSLYSLASILPGLSVLVRRLHDTNRSGWWFWIALIPVIGQIWLLVLLVSDGTRGSNRFGEDPKGPAHV